MRVFTKRIAVTIVVMLGVLIIAALSAVLINNLQVSKDMNVLSRFASRHSELMFLAEGAPVPLKRHTVCRPQGAAVMNCPALLYKISEDNCKTVLAAKGVTRQWCGYRYQTTFEGRPIEVTLGQVYEMDDGNFYVQIVMNEDNLLAAIGMDF